VLKKDFSILVVILIVFNSCDSSSNMNFINKNENYLGGDWELKKIEILDNNQKKIFFSIDSTNFNFKILNIDTKKMLFHLKSYPFSQFEPKYRILINNDTIKLKSGAIMNGQILFKNIYIFGMTKDNKYLKLKDLKEKKAMIFSKK
tara:strand:+ start:634 stop:1071 length:438 start_codon:yes stop_codon:yes gene_type:complete